MCQCTPSSMVSWCPGCWNKAEKVSPRRPFLAIVNGVEEEAVSFHDLVMDCIERSSNKSCVVHAGPAGCGFIVEFSKVAE